MFLKKLLYGFIIVSLIMVSLAGCSTAPEPPAIQLVPEGVTILGQVQVGKVLADQDLRNAYNQWKKEPDQPQTVDDALKMVVEKTGLDINTFSQALLFGDTNNISSSASYAAFIIEGTFDAAKFISSMEAKSSEKFTTASYKGYKLYTNQDQKFAVTFLSNKILLFGTPKAVQDIIDVRKGDRKAVSGAILDTYNKLGNAMCRFAVIMPESARKSMAEQSVPGSPISTKTFANMDVLGLALDKQLAAVTVKIDSHFIDTTSAQDARDTLIGAVFLFKGMLTDQALKDLFGKISVTGQDNWLTISLNTTVAELETLVNTFRK